MARGGKTRNNPARKRDGPSAEGTPTAAGGYSIQPSSRERTPSAFVSRRPDVKSPPGGRSADLPDRLGLVRAPEQPERSLLISLLYPFWDGGGIALLVLMAPVLCVTSLCVFGLIPLVIRGGNMLVMGPFAFPMVLIFALALGFVLQVLEQFLVASAAGEVSHPRWPNVNFFGILGCLVRWLGAGALGVLPAFILATVAWWDGESVSVLACAKTAGLIAVGAVYSLMALVAIVLHDDLRAASPLIVLRAVALTGGPYLRSCLLAGLAAGAPLVLLAMILRMEDFWLIVAATWLFWVVALYGVLVVLRVLGLAYHRRAQDLGWFPERPRWGAGTSVRR